MSFGNARRMLMCEGVGKGTQSDRLLKRYPQLSSISSGDLLRDNVRQKTPLGIQADSIMRTGGLVPDTMILRLIHNALTTRGWLVPVSGAETLTLSSTSTTGLDPSQSLSHSSNPSSLPPLHTRHDYNYSDSPSASFILDGFPRTSDQAAQLAQLLPINMVIHIHTPTPIVLDRICNRWIHPASGRIYNTTFNAPKVDRKDDLTGEALIQRDDDKPEVWKERLRGFEEKSQPLLAHYEKEGVLWKVEGDSSDEITPKIFEEFQRRFGA
ncbi:Adenylate kinase 2 [Friedmanniomyces endolithicus]|uniref:GTP:AMP phosphotransferase, mitochondrial n=2 Tax=Friedmanniomyces endolithicus TaxID=329885 RepID=A0AAN6L2C6_9PEZI|nr:Adenylate kinase 2 [Friedmanniomyces endolithicus]KAK0999834.1 Adenylate kinase 2 [Friedmanniomyces endolithicus]KAK1016069.1 Adenylate kinase 2 [Friedmanniomyces endolithicus]KAK1054465.1 Adenylate kinase 2 [Friedmanniomyces endolithicus]